MQIAALIYVCISTSIHYDYSIGWSTKLPPILAILAIFVLTLILILVHLK